MKKIFFSFLIFISVFFNNSNAQSSLDFIAKKWQVIQEDGTIDSNSFLNVSSDEKFIRYDHKGTGFTTFGGWKMVDSSIFMSLDSTIYLNSNQERMVAYPEGYQEGIVVYNEDDFFDNALEFKIIKLSNDSLWLFNKINEKIEKYICACKLSQSTVSYSKESNMTSISFKGFYRGVLGIFTLLFIAWLFSANRAAINWSLVGKGLLIQFILAIAVLYVPFVEHMFDSLAKGFNSLIKYTDYGADFLFGSFVTGDREPGTINFAFKVLPTIIFFSALMSVLYYIGLLQLVVKGFAWVMQKVMKLSGAESLAAAGNIFMGQTESPLLVKPYLPKMTKSEMMCLMTGGMATIAGGVLASYIGFLGGGDEQEAIFFAKHLLTASVMSAPAAVVAAKMLVPETEEFNTDLTIPKDKIGSNILEAISNGTTDGLKLAINVGAMLLVFTAFIYFLNGILEWFGDWSNLNIWIANNTDYKTLSFQFILGYSFAPVAWLLGVDNWNDMVLTGQLLGEKTILNEFYAYATLGNIKEQFISEKAIVMSTYMLCGFANFASIGIQIGGIGALVPDRKGLLSQLGVRALLGGTLACLFTAVIVGMLM